MASKGRRVSLSELAGEPTLDGARVPPRPDAAARSVRIDRVAANPLNSRDPYGRPEKIAELAASMKQFGQLQPCTVVTYDVFVAQFPERRGAVAGADYVQVTGSRRRAAALEAQLPTLDIAEKNDLAASRALFIAATAAENIDRDNYDLIEEARQVQLLVQECGSGKDAATQLNRTPGWVSQRLNLLKLVPELQDALRNGEIPQREVRDLHRCSSEEQIAALQHWREATAAAAPGPDNADGNGEREGEPDPGANEAATAAPRQRRSPVVTAIRRLGGTPVKIAESLRAELPPEALRELAEELLREDS